LTNEPSQDTSGPPHPCCLLFAGLDESRLLLLQGLLVASRQLWEEILARRFHRLWRRQPPVYPQSLLQFS